MNRRRQIVAAALAAALALVIVTPTAAQVTVIETVIRSFTKALAGDGSASAPSYSFASAPTYGTTFSGASSTAVLDVIYAGSPKVRLADGSGGPGYGVLVRSDGQFAWNSGALTTGTQATPDTWLSRGGAAGKITLTGTTPMIQWGGSTSSFPALKQVGTSLQARLGDDSGDAAFTAGSLQGNSYVRNAAANITGVTATGETDLGSQVQTQTFKVTVTSAAFVCAATTCDVTLATMPAKMAISHVVADLTQTFACTATCTTSTLSMTVGKTAGGNQYLLSFDADAATAQFGLTSATLGASLAPSTAPTLIGDVASWSSTTNIVLRLTSGTGNIGNGSASNLSQGSVSFSITYTQLR